MKKKHQIKVSSSKGRKKAGRKWWRQARQEMRQGHEIRGPR